MQENRVRQLLATVPYDRKGSRRPWAQSAEPTGNAIHGRQNATLADSQHVAVHHQRDSSCPAEIASHSDRIHPWHEAREPWHHPLVVERSELPRCSTLHFHSSGHLRPPNLLGLRVVEPAT